MPSLSNTRHEAFAQACAAGMSYSDAYRATYGTKARNIDTLSSRLALSGNVGKRIVEIQREAKAAAVLTFEKKREMLAEFARDKNAAIPHRIRAIELDARLAHELTEKIEVKDVTLREPLDEIRARLRRANAQRSLPTPGVS